MADRPIIFSAPMVLALLAGRKTQTRRLATSPLRRCEAGDRLWVREAWRTLHKFDCLKPKHLADDPSKITFEADPENRNPIWAFGKLRPSIHMPRWASRLTLIVEAVRVERLQAISWDDAVAEGIVERPKDGALSTWGLPDWPDADCRIHPGNAYARLWTSLHGADSWAANPEVVAITFRVVRGNIDRGEG